MEVESPLLDIDSLSNHTNFDQAVSSVRELLGQMLDFNLPFLRLLYNLQVCLSCLILFFSLDD